MEYIKATVYTTPQASELLADILAPITGGCVIDDPNTIQQFLKHATAHWDYIDKELFANPHRRTSVSFYVPAGADGEKTLLAVGNALKDTMESDGAGFFGKLTLELAEADGTDWENNWKQYYKPFNIGCRLLVRPSWESAENPQNRVVLTIDPASSFGTGLHATTRLCIEQLDGMYVDGKNVLDVGCGSGILGCVAMLFGAKALTACDIEQNAASATAENMERNDMGDSDFKVFCGDLLTDSAVSSGIEARGSYDIITANIVSDVLMAMGKQLKDLLAPDGLLILSGIISERAREVRQYFEALHMVLSREAEEKGWTMLVFKRQI